MPKTERVAKAEGVYLQRVGESRSWLLRYRIHGKEHWMGLGPYRHGKRTKGLNLDQAKAKARAIHVNYLDKGLDPLVEKRKEKAARLLEESKTILFEPAARQWYEQNKYRWTNAKKRSAFLAALKNHVFAKIGSMPVADITVSDVLRVIEPLWMTKTTTADRVRWSIEQVLAWATALGYRAGDNPAKWEGLKPTLPAKNKVAKPRHFKALPYSQMPDFWKDLSKRVGGAAAALRLLILTGVRSGDVRGARWSEIDFQNKLWVIPGTGRSEEEEVDGIIVGTKTRTDYIVPLSDEALAVINAQPKVSEFIFVGPSGQLSENAVMTLVKKRMKVDVHQHGFRTTLTDWAGDCTNTSEEVIRFVKGHQISDKTTAAYRRTTAVEKRRKLMSSWARYITGQTPTAKVIPIRKTA